MHLQSLYTYYQTLLTLNNIQQFILVALIFGNIWRCTIKFLSFGSVPIHFRFGRAGNGVWPSLKVKNLQLPFYSIASHHPAGSSLIISLLILTGSIARRIRMPRVRFAMLIDCNSAQSRSIRVCSTTIYSAVSRPFHSREIRERQERKGG